MSFHVIIEPGRTEKNYWKDLWRYRELFYILSWRDIKVRYKQATLGILWAILRPLLTMVDALCLLEEKLLQTQNGTEAKTIKKTIKKLIGLE